MTPIVLDCSVALTWVFAEEARPETDALLLRVEAQGAVVPPIWPLEVANVLVSAERRQRIAPGGAALRLRHLWALDVRVDEALPPSDVAEIIHLALDQRLTAYDAAYLALARRTGLPLATIDAALAAAAKRVGVVVLPDIV